MLINWQMLQLHEDSISFIQNS